MDGPDLCDRGESERGRSLRGRRIECSISRVPHDIYIPKNLVLPKNLVSFSAVLFKTSLIAINAMLPHNLTPSLTRRDTGKSSVGTDSAAHPPPVGGVSAGEQNTRAIYRHIHEMAAKRISTLDYLRRAFVHPSTMRQCIADRLGVKAMKGICIGSTLYASPRQIWGGWHTLSHKN